MCKKSNPPPPQKDTPQKLNFSDFFFRFNLKKNFLWVLHGPCISSNMWVVFWKLSGFHLSLEKKPSPYSAGSQRTSLLFWEKKVLVWEFYNSLTPLVVTLQDLKPSQEWNWRSSCSWVLTPQCHPPKRRWRRKRTKKRPWQFRPEIQCGITYGTHKVCLL